MCLLWITYEIKPGIFDEKRGNAALLIKNSGFYFIFDPMNRKTQITNHNFEREEGAVSRVLFLSAAALRGSHLSGMPVTRHLKRIGRHGLRRTSEPGKDQP